LKIFTFFAKPAKKYKMKKRNCYFFFLFGIIISVLFYQTAYGQGSKLTINQLMVTNESGDGDAGLIADEQYLAGDPGANSGGSPLTKWSTASSGTYPKSAYIDLGYEAEIVKICIYDANSTSNLIVESGTPGSWTTLFTDPLTNYNKWNTHNVNVQSRYLRLVKTTATANFSEVVVYAVNAQILPPAICNLSVSGVNNHEIQLTWTNVPANSATGAFTGFDVRYNTVPIHSNNFLSSYQFVTNSTPGDPGTGQSLTVTGLQANTPYYFAIKALGSIQSTGISNIASGTTLMYYNQIESKVLLTTSMVINESGYGDAKMMVDEQNIAGDPGNGAGGAPTTQWSPGSSSGLYPASAYFDLGQPVFITQLFIRDVNSVGNLIVETGMPGSWNYLLTDPCSNYNKWNQHSVQKVTRYLRFTKSNSEAKFSEIVLYKGEQGALPEIKIAITPEMVTNISGFGDPSTLFDEQELAGDPAGSTGGNPLTKWETGWGSSVVHPAYALIDLEKPYDITKIFLRDANDIGDFTVDYGTPGDWQPLFIDNLTGYLSWNQHDVGVTSRYLRFGKSSPSSFVSEIVIYGMDSSPSQSDTIKPAAITNLQVVSTGQNTVMLQWTAPGDDDMTGTALAYEIRYSLDSITDQNYYSCPLISSPVTPSLAGNLQNQEVVGLNYYTRYYFAIRTIDDYQNISEISNVTAGKTTIVINGPVQKIQLSPAMVLNESALGDQSLLVDEQGISGDPKANPAGIPVTRWIPSSIEWQYPAFAAIDLGATYRITEIYLFDESDAGCSATDPVTIKTGTPFSWEFAYTDSLTSSKTWKSFNVNQTARYLRVEFISSDVRMSEIVVYGYPLENPEPEPESVKHIRPTMDQLIGINAFVDDPLGRLQVAGMIREYHNWRWCEGNNSPYYTGYPKNQNEFDVSSLGWNFDRFYTNLKKMGITTVPCIQDNVLWLTNNNYSKFSDKPVSPGEDPVDYESYYEHADHMYQYAARYGSATVPLSTLKVASSQDKLSGQNLLTYYESWNEPDKWWKNRDAFFTPYEYAAMASADADGHYGKMGETYGLRSADPNAKFVMAGLAWAKLDYIKAMVLWSKYFRPDGQLPVDVINIHHYSNNGGGQQTGTVGVSPEQDNLKGKLEEFVTYRNRYLPGKEVWISEFGYDTHPTSKQRAPVIAGYSQEEVQAQWIIRSFLAVAAAGIDKAHMYMLRDVDPNSSTQFNTSGLCSSRSTGMQPKPSWYYLYTLKTRLTGMRYSHEVSSGNSNVSIYKFIHDSQPMAAYVVWCPTSDGTVVNDFLLNLNASEINAMQVQLQAGSRFGVSSLLLVNGSKVSLNVSESPVIVMVSDGTPFIEPVSDEKITLTTSMVINESGLGNAGNLVNEQEIAGDVDNGNGGECVTGWKPSTTSSGYPASAYIDLGTIRNISKLYLRDMSGVGNATISIGSPENWQVVATDKLNKYKSWNAHYIGQSTRYIRVTLYTPNSNLSEIVIYGN